MPEPSIPELLSLVETTPEQLRALTDGVSVDRLTRRNAPDEWSPLDVLNHLRACEEVWIHSVHTMLAFEDPRPKEIHPQQWTKQPSPYWSVSFESGLETFRLRRLALLGLLRDLPAEAWERSATIGRKTHTVFSRVHHMAKHEAHHYRQIEGLLG